MLKKMPGIDRFRHSKDLYRAQAIIGENGGNDSWKVNVKIWKYPHEQKWRYTYGCEGSLLTATGEAYGPKSGEGEGFDSPVSARAAMIEAMEKDYA